MSEDNEQENKNWLANSSRRELLKLVGVGAFAGPGALLSSGTVSAAAELTGDVVLDQDFEDLSVGAYPDGWVKDGNQSQGVTDNFASSGSKSLELRGSHGGCWQAVANAPLKFPDEGQLEISFAFRPTTNGSFGCHPYRGNVDARTDAGWWGGGDGISLLSFEPDGTVSAHGETVSEYSVDSWNTVQYSYTRKKTDSGEKVTVEVTVNGNTAKFERKPRDFEDQLKYLTFRSGDFTTQIDNIKATKGSVSQPSSDAIVWPDSIDFGPMIKGSSPVRPLTVTNPNSSSQSIKVENIETDGGVNLITGNFFEDISSSKTPVELNPGETAIFLFEAASDIVDSIGSVISSIIIDINGNNVKREATGAVLGKETVVNNLAESIRQLSIIFEGISLDAQYTAANEIVKAYESIIQSVGKRAGKQYLDAAQEVKNAADAIVSLGKEQNIRYGIEVWASETDVSPKPYEIQNKLIECHDNLMNCKKNIQNNNLNKAQRNYNKAEKNIRSASNLFQEAIEDSSWVYVDNNTMIKDYLWVENKNQPAALLKDMVSSISQTSTVLFVNSPVDIKVQQQSTLISKTQENIPGSEYFETNLDRDGEQEDLVLIPDTEAGSFRIQVVPEEDANKTDTYSIAWIQSSETHVLANDVEVGDIPEDGYTLQQPLEAEVDIHPQTISGNGNFLTSYLQLPEGYGVRKAAEDAVEVTRSVEGDPSDQLVNLVDQLERIIRENVATASVTLESEGGDVEKEVEGYLDNVQENIVEKIIDKLQDSGSEITVFLSKEIDWERFKSTIDLSTVQLNGEVSAIDNDKYGFVKNPEIEDRDEDGLPEVMVKFPMDKAYKSVERGASSDININGRTADRLFVGSDTVRVIQHGDKRGRRGGKGKEKEGEDNGRQKGRREGRKGNDEEENTEEDAERGPGKR